MKKLLVVVLALGLMLIPAACGSDDESTSDQPGGDQGTSNGWPVKIDSALGTATIPEEPKRVVTIGWGSEDAALALGVKPVGMSINVAEDPGGITPWAKQKLGGATPTMFDASTDNIPYEKVAALKPDVILAVYSGLDDEQYKTLSEIAPVVAYPKEAWSTSWEDQIRLVGQALGKSDQAAKLTADVKQQIADAAKQHPEFRGKTAIFGSGTEAGSYNLYVPSDARMQLLGQLGFKVSDAATATFDHDDEESTFATSFSLEQIPELKTDVLVSWYLSKSVQSQIEKQPVFQNLPAVKRGGYLPITDPNMVYATSAPNVLTIPWMLNTYVPELSKAAKGNK